MVFFCFRNRPVIQLLLEDVYDNIQNLLNPVSRKVYRADIIVDTSPKTYNLRARKAVNYRV
jgi:hypothetical protein|uniref:Uncharacterized protein n=1 Tax=viral metagenome TaxID=1070528 RepID=A0A6C0K881_9ZZZZ